MAGTLALYWAFVPYDADAISGGSPLSRVRPSPTGSGLFVRTNELRMVVDANRMIENYQRSSWCEGDDHLGAGPLDQPQRRRSAAQNQRTYFLYRVLRPARTKHLLCWQCSSDARL